MLVLALYPADAMTVSLAWDCALAYCHARARQTVAVGFTGGGKSGLHRARCQVTPGRREPTESATEIRPPMALRKLRTGKGEKVR